MINDIIFCNFNDHKSIDGNKVVYFQHEEEYRLASFDEYDKHILAVLAPDDNWRTNFQEKYYYINFEIGSPASILDPLQFIPSSTKTFDVAIYIDKRLIEDFYIVYSKTSMLKWLICCLDSESFEFFSKVRSNSTLLLSGCEHYDKLSEVGFLVEFTGYNRCAPKRVGVCFCFDVPVLAVIDGHFHNDCRTDSIWDDLLTSGTCVMNTRYLLSKRIIWFAKQGSLKWLKPRLYYETFLGKQNLSYKILSLVV